MKLVIFLTLLFYCLYSHSQAGQIRLSLKELRGDSTFKRDCELSFKIASLLLSSPEFKQALQSSNFPHWNNCNHGKGRKDTVARIAFQEIFDSLNKNTSASFLLILKESSRSTLGFTTPKSSQNRNSYYTTAFWKNIVTDMPDLPFAYSLAANLCHEYMHFIGFCHLTQSFDEPDRLHPDPIGYKNDIGYRVGWTAYYILVDWHKQCKKFE